MPKHTHSKGGKGRFHPSRTPGHAKFALMLDINNQPKKKKSKIKPLDLSKSNWSL